MTLNSRKILLILLALAWLFAVTFNYYIVHKPFALENALALLDAALNLVTALALFALAAALGRRLLRAFEFAAPLERVVFHAGFGWGLISFATLALGLAGVLNGILFWTLVLGFLLLLRTDLRALVADMRSLSSPSSLSISRFDRFLVFFLLVSLSLTFLYALTPPIAWDAQTYHLVIPQTALERGRIAAPPDNPYFSFPSLVEMLFLAAMALKGDVAAQLIHFGYFLLLLGAVHACASRYFTARVGLRACAILVAVPSLLLVSTWAYVDAALAFYAFAAFYLARVAVEKADARWFALAGTFAGFATGVKYTAVIVPVAVIGVLVIGNWRLVRCHWSLITVYCSLLALFAAPWYLRNLAFTGNPFYPFFFGGLDWDVFRANWFGRFGTGLLNDPLKLLTAPWDATIYGVEGALGYEATVGVLVLALIPLLIVPSPESKVQSQDDELRRTDYELRDLVLFSAILYAFWLIGLASSKLLQQTRLLFPAFAFFALFASIALDRLRALDLPPFSLQRFAQMLAALVLGLTLTNYVLGFASDNPLPYLVGAQTRAQWLARHLSEYYKVAQFLNQLPHPRTHILSLWEPRAYYIHPRVQPDSILDRFPHTVAQTRDADAIVRQWRAAGYTHVLLNRHGLNLLLTSQYDPISLDDARVLEKILTAHAQQLYGAPLEVVNGAIPRAEEEPYAVYELK